ncbi:5976_t:CDS:2 [Cetraspora pellucida]|uniref:5976_t:CDS:1 n=1 Tax=Cetraspora pellucida TaxID=1433469 RepID=A0A9N8VKA2_9GLOM|nr:5976_t:CDS:2 [Cetraspora pellucida]
MKTHFENSHEHGSYFFAVMMKGYNYTFYDNDADILKHYYPLIEFINYFKDIRDQHLDSEAYYYFKKLFHKQNNNPNCHYQPIYDQYQIQNNHQSIQQNNVFQSQPNQLQHQQNNLQHHYIQPNFFSQQNNYELQPGSSQTTNISSEQIMEMFFQFLQNNVSINNESSISQNELPDYLSNYETATANTTDINKFRFHLLSIK